MSVSNVSNSLTRASIMEYASVLVALDEMIALYSVSDSINQKAAKAKTLATLLYVLEDMQYSGLSGCSVIRDLASTILERAASVKAAIGSGAGQSVIAEAIDNFVYLDLNSLAKTTIVAEALDPTSWVDGSSNPITIRDATSDAIFYSFYRYADATLISDLGQLANRLQASNQFLKALNDVYKGASWNPGTNFISDEGTLQDYTDSSGNYHSWYNQFSADGMNNVMIRGALNIKTMLDSGIFPTRSLEYNAANQIIDLFYRSYDEGGYERVATADATAHMWSDRTFKIILQNAIEGTTRLNEQTQLSLSKLLTIYDFYVRTSTNLATRDNESLVNIANHIKDV